MGRTNRVRLSRIAAAACFPAALVGSYLVSLYGDRHEWAKAAVGFTLFAALTYLLADLALFLKWEEENP